MAGPGDYGSFVPTTNVWDVSSLYSVDINSQAFRELLVRLYQNVNKISIGLNIKDTGYYDTQEFVNGQLFFPNPLYTSQSTTTPAFRQVFRSVINFGALPNTGTKSVPHKVVVTPSVTVTRLYGGATLPATDGSMPTPASFLPLPYVSATSANCIELNADSTNINITTGSDRSAYTITYVIFEYLKN